MRVLIDADGCPVVDIAVKEAKQHKIKCIILCDTSHLYEKDGARTIIVPKGADSVDYALVNMLQKGDIVITQDYGLAAMCLAKNAIPINQDGMVYCDDNIESLLQSRYMAKKVRDSGGRLKGQSKRKPKQDKLFRERFVQLLIG